MAKHISVTFGDRLCAILPYLFPITTVHMIAWYPFYLLPPLEILLSPFLQLNKMVGVAFLLMQYLLIANKNLTFLVWITPNILTLQFRLLVLLCIFIFVVKNNRVNPFIRFNTMQALLLDIVILTLSVIISFLVHNPIRIDVFTILLRLIVSLSFLILTSTFTYSIFQCVRGKYPKLPIISDFIYHQIRYEK